MDRPMDVRLARLHYPIEALGPGRRVGVWFQGCTLACAGCMSRDTWTPDGGWAMSVGDLASKLVTIVGDHTLNGVTISGGEPFEQPDALRSLVEHIANDLPDTDVLVFSGFTQRYLERHHSEILTLVDAVVSGRFVAGRPTDEPWRGSANQRLVVLRDRARLRYAPESVVGPRLQVGADEHGLYVTGIPRRSDLDGLVDALAARGVLLDEVSWRP